ncbi:MAG: hypothetical protein ACR2N9_03275 [Acidimicrobiia bacterium]
MSEDRPDSEDVLPSRHDGHSEERFSHALYGLIIITATLAAERLHVESARDALGLLLGTALVLLLVHTYTAVMAVRSVEGHALGNAGRRMVVADNLPVVAAVVVPAAAFILAGIGAIELRTAYQISIGFSIVALILLGLYQGRKSGMSWPKSAVSGAVAGGIGVLMIIFEAVFE